MREAPDELVPMAVIKRDEDGNCLLHLQLAYAGDPAAGERFATAILGDVRDARAGFRACTYVDIQAINEIKSFGTRRNYWSSTFVTDLDDKLIDLLVEAAPSLPHPWSDI